MSFYKIEGVIGFNEYDSDNTKMIIPVNFNSI